MNTVMAGDIIAVGVSPSTLKGVCKLLGGKYEEAADEKRCSIQLSMFRYLVIERDDRLEIYTISERTKRVDKIVETKPPDRYACSVAVDTKSGPVSTTCNFDIDVHHITPNVDAPDERVVVKVSPIQGTVSVRHYSVGVVVSSDGEPVEALMPLGGENLKISDVVRATFIPHYRRSVTEELGG